LTTTEQYKYIPVKEKTKEVIEILMNSKAPGKDMIETELLKK